MKINTIDWLKLASESKVLLQNIYFPDAAKEEWIKIFESWKRLYIWLHQEIQESAADALDTSHLPESRYCVFLLPNEQAIQVKIIQEATNQVPGASVEYQQLVFGEGLGLRRPGANDTNSLNPELISQLAGFLCIDPEGNLCICSPIQINTDRTLEHFCSVPVGAGRSQLLAFYISSLEERKLEAKFEDESEEGRKKILENMRFEKILLRQGRSARPGKNSELIFHLKNPTKPSADAKEAIDYRSLSRYQEIKSNTLIAEKTIAIQGEAGIDIEGKVIPVAAVTDTEFKVNENINAENQGQKIEFRSRIEGALLLTEHSALLTEFLRIKGDVCYDTGNLEFSRDILVEGSILSGFSVHCGGNLIVKGGLEDAVEITCKGNVTIEGGIFGVRTRVQVQGNLEVKFVQESYIRVEGVLKVNTYLYQANAFAGKLVVVEGKSTKNTGKGAIIGGHLSCLGNVLLHSAGSHQTRTEIHVGIDTELMDKLKQLEESLPTLTKRIVLLKSEIDANLGQGHQLDQLDKLPSAKKLSVLKILDDLKKNLTLKNTIEEKIKQGRETMKKKENDKLVVLVEHHVVPDVYIRILDCSSTVKFPEVGKRYFSREGYVLSNNCTQGEWAAIVAKAESPSPS